MEILIDFILLWAMMLGWLFTGLVVGILMMITFIIVKDWSDKNVQ